MYKQKNKEERKNGADFLRGMSFSRHEGTQKNDPTYPLSISRGSARIKESGI
jgi:hypothetical protein